MSGEYASSLLSTSAFVLGVIRAADALLGGVNPADLDAVFGAEEEERMERRSVRYFPPFFVPFDLSLCTNCVPNNYSWLVFYWAK